MRSGFALVVLSAVALVACGDDPKPDAPAAVTVLSPQPGATFVTSVDVTFTTDREATVIVTTDGTDPLTSPTRQTLTAPGSITLTRTTTLQFYSHTSDGADEPLRTATYTRINYVSGVVVAGSIAREQRVGLIFDGQEVDLGVSAQPGEIAFTIDHVQPGSHSAKAYADRDGDHAYTPVLDPESSPLSFIIAADKPWKDDVRILLGVSQPGSGTIDGTASFSRPVANEGLTVLPLDPALLTSASFNPGALDLELRFQTMTTATQLQYPYVLTNLPPGSYIPVAMLTSPSLGSLNFVYRGVLPMRVDADETETAQFEFGSKPLGGQLTLQLSRALPSGAVLRVIVAGRSSTPFATEYLVMPCTVESVSGSSTRFTGSFGAEGVRDSDTFGLKVFTSIDGTPPTAQAGAWLVTGTPAPDKSAAAGDSAIDLTVAVSVQ